MNKLQAEERYRVQILKTELGIIHDVAAPVLGGKAGVVRIGMSEATIKAQINQHINGELLWVVVVLIVGLYIAYGLAVFLTKPIAQLAQAARAVGTSEFRWKPPIWAKDEIGSLGVTFSEMSEELKQKEEMRTQLLAKVISTQEAERKRIARELHDETGQSLASLMVGLRLIEDSSDITEIREKIAELREVAALTMDEVHHLAAELRPSLLDDLGLVDAIQRYTKEYSVKMNINIGSHVSSLSEQHLSPEIELSAFRIIQEALTNIAKHAEAKTVSVVLTSRDSSLVIIVEDDGKGFDVNRVMASANDRWLGLFGMYERASLIGGKLVIESQPETGTTVFLEVPLKLR